MLPVGQTYNLKIQTLAFGGEGIGRVDNFVVFVPFTVPGDEVEVTITESKKSFARAQLRKVITPSSSRQEPFCPVYGTCGGCQLQHINYNEQLRYKTEALQNYLVKHLKISAALVASAAPSPKTQRYRNRVQVRVQQGQLGYFAPGTHDIVAIEDCPITEESITQKFAQIREQFSSEEKTTKLELALTTDGGLVVSRDQPHGAETGFYQVNTLQNKNLVALATATVKQGQADNFLDLYCGQGNFLLNVAREHKQLNSLLGVELSSSAVRTLRKTIADENLQNVQVSEGDVLKFLTQWKPKGRWSVLIDPPRIGCDHRVIRYLNPQLFDHLVYVSCNPTTFARDAALLMDQGWQLHSIKPIDMFPHTFHLELVASFQKVLT